MNFTFKKKIIIALLNEEPYFQKFDDEKRQFIEDYMLEHHPDLHTLKIDKIWTQKNPTYNHNNFHIDGKMNGVNVRQWLLSTNSCRAVVEKSMPVRIV